MATTFSTFTGTTSSGIGYGITSSHGFDTPQRLILTSGYNGGIASWPDRFVQGLAAKGIDVVTYNLRGIGRPATRGNPDLTITDMAEDFATVLQAVGEGKIIHHLGWSLGGNIATVAAQRYPEQVQKTVLLCTTPGGGSPLLVPSDPNALDQMKNPTLTGGLLGMIMGPWHACLSDQDLANHDEELKTLAKAITRGGLPSGRTTGHWDAWSRFDAAPLLDIIPGPVLVIGADRDRMASLENSHRLAEKIKNSTLAVLAGAEHMPHITHTERLIKLITDFLL